MGPAMPTLPSPPGRPTATPGCPGIDDGPQRYASVTSQGSSARLEPARARPRRSRTGPLVLLVLLAAVPIAEGWAARGVPWRRFVVVLSHPGRSLHAWSHPVDGTDIIVGLLVLGAIGWLWLLACVVVEVVCRWRCRPRWHLPGSAWLQQTVSVLLGSAMVVAPVSRVGGSAPAGAAVWRTPVVAASAAAAGPASESGAAMLPAPPKDRPRASSSPPSDGPARSADAWPASARLYTVQPGDTLWSIAARQLGSPLRWRQLAAANLGRPQPDGGCLVDDNWILPGWTLVLPGPAAPVASPGLLVTAPKAPVDVPMLSSAAATADVSALSQVTSSKPGTPPADAAPPARVGRRAGDGELVLFGVLAASVVAVVDRLRRVPQRRRPTGWRIALPPADVASLERRLRASADTHVAQQVVDVVRQVRRMVAEAGARAPRLAALWISPSAVEVLCVSPSDEVGPPLASTVERPSPPPGFLPGQRADCWRLPWPPKGQRVPIGPAGRVLAGRDQASTEWWHRHVVAAGRDVPATVVTLGRSGDALVAVDLAVVGALGIDHPRADAIGHAVAVELATNPAAEPLELVLCGFAPSFDVFDRVRRVDDTDQLLALIEDRVLDRLTRRVPTAPAAPEGAAGAWSVPPEDGEQLVVLCAAGAHLSPTVAAELVRLASASDGAVAIVMAAAPVVVPWQLVATPVGSAELRWSPGPGTAGHPGEATGGTQRPTAGSAVERGGAVEVADDHARYGAGGPACWSSLEVQELSAAAVAGIADILRVATDGDGVVEPGVSVSSATARDDGGLGDVDGPTSVDTTGPGTLEMVRSAPTPARRSGTRGPVGTGTVVVRVLGPVEVEGAERPFGRAWTLDLVVYLALHPNGATTDQWSTALWPDRLMAPASLHSTASAARRALGARPDGQDHLPRGHGRLQLAPSVTTDWQAFQALAGQDDPVQWRRALELVRGRPLDGIRSVDWAILEGLLPAMEASVVDTAERLGHVHLERRDPSGAEWAARRGLVVSPYDERLYRILLRSADLAGNPAGVEAVMAELVRLVAEDVEPDDAVHPETLSLYRALSRRADRIGAR